MIDYKSWVKQSYGLDVETLSDEDDCDLSEMYAGLVTEEATERYYEDRPSQRLF